MTPDQEETVKKWLRKAMSLRARAEGFRKEGNIERANLFERTATDADKIADEIYRRISTRAGDA